MSSQNGFIDYYKVLECERTATLEEIKRNYQRLVLISHPDKINTKTDQFHLVQQAWSVLRDPKQRKQYDAELTCEEHSNILLYDSLSLSELEWDADNNVYVHSCRCGGTYVFEKANYKTSSVIIECDECSFAIQVNL